MCKQSFVMDGHTDECWMDGLPRWYSRLHKLQEICFSCFAFVFQITTPPHTQMELLFLIHSACGLMMKISRDKRLDAVTKILSGKEKLSPTSWMISIGAFTSGKKELSPTSSMNLNGAFTSVEKELSPISSMISNGTFTRSGEKFRDYDLQASWDIFLLIDWLTYMFSFLFFFSNLCVIDVFSHGEGCGFCCCFFICFY